MIVFFASFILYLVTLFPGVAPYRDTGEMVSVAHTLGVAHPPGYPLYTLLAKASLHLMPLANAGYALNVLSAVFGALTVFLLYAILKRIGARPFIAGCAALLFGASYLQWYLALVSEMYTVNTFFAALVLYLAVVFADKVRARESSQRVLVLTVFVFFLALGNRMDLLMMAPGLAWLLYVNRKEVSIGALPAALMVAILGFSIFLYLPVRSSHAPLLDWNHPATIGQLWGSITRKTHGGTLDLISAPYAKGENFPATMAFYLNHIWSGFAFAGIPLAAAGLYSLGKRRKDLLIASVLAWFFSGPVFIFMSNMPPNPHALAILEAHFLLPNLFVALWIGEGLSRVEHLARSRTAAYVGAALLLCLNLALHFPELDKRNSFVAYDYARNILRSAPPRSIVVMKKDVQLFSLWNQQLVENKRPDLTIISQGLSGSSWYRKPMERLHPDVFVGPLRTADDWKNFAAANSGREIYFSGDVDYQRPEKFVEESDGLLSRMTPGTLSPRGDVLLRAVYPYRGDYRYGDYREFFTPDLIEDNARAHVYYAQYLITRGRLKEGEEFLKRAWYRQPLLPMAGNYAGFLYFQQGDYPKAAEAYLDAARQYRNMLELAAKYNSLPDVRAAFARDLADVYISLGACQEKLGDDEKSLEAYRQALTVYPNAAKAYFNRAVIYWKKREWGRVEADLQNALRVDPDYAEAAYYLNTLKRNSR